MLEMDAQPVVPEKVPDILGTNLGSKRVFRVIQKVPGFIFIS